VATSSLERDSREPATVASPLCDVFCRLRSRGAHTWLEPDDGKLSRPVLRGGSGSDAASLPDSHSAALTGNFSAFKQTIPVREGDFPVGYHGSWSLCSCHTLRVLSDEAMELGSMIPIILCFTGSSERIECDCKKVTMPGKKQAQKMKFHST
jgi:hypothetical protein